MGQGGRGFRSIEGRSSRPTTHGIGIRISARASSAGGPWPIPSWALLSNRDAPCLLACSRSLGRGRRRLPNADLHHSSDPRPAERFGFHRSTWLDRVLWGVGTVHKSRNRFGRCTAQVVCVRVCTHALHLWGASIACIDRRLNQPPPITPQTSIHQPGAQPHKAGRGRLKSPRRPTAAAPPNNVRRPRVLSSVAPTLQPPAVGRDRRTTGAGQAR